MTTDQAIAKVSYKRPRTEITSDVELRTEFRLVAPEFENQVKIEQYIDLNSTATAQEDTITITAGNEDDIYTISVEVDGQQESYSYQQSSTDTASSIATKLARRIDLDSHVRATASGIVITLVAVEAGVEVQYDNVASTTLSNSVIGNVTSASGSAQKALINTVKLNFDVDANGIPEVEVLGNFYSGSPTAPVTINNYGPLPAKGSKSLDEMQTEAGVNRDS